MQSRLEMIRRFLTVLLAIGTGLGVTALSIPTSAWAAEEVRSVSGFEAVALEHAAKVKVELSDREFVKVTGGPRAVESVQTVVEDRDGVSTLVIRGKRWPWFSPASEVVVTVQGPRFQAFSVSGSGEIDARLSNQPALRLALAGSGDLRVQGLTAHRVDVNVSGSGDVRVQGAAQNLSVNLAGSGDAWLRDLEAEDVRVSVAGSGDARVHARQRLRVSVAGSGDVRYSGPAQDVSATVAGSGRVTRE